MTPFEWFVGLRYTRSARVAGRGNGFISFIATLGVAGIALGVASLIVVLSVMNGFQKDVRDRMLSVLPHIEVRSERGLEDWRELADRIERDEPRIVGAAPMVAGQVVATVQDSVRGALLRGIDPAAEPAVSEIAGQMRQGRIDELVPGRFGIAVGRVLADQLGLLPGDRLSLLAPQATVTPAGVVPRVRQFTVIGLFESGHYEFDSAMIVANVEDASRFLRDDGVAGLRLRTNDIQAAPRIAADVGRRLGPGFEVRDWSTENRVWFAAVQVEKRMMFLIMLLVIAVAAFNLVSMLVMTVNAKRPDIAILRTLGASPKSVMAIFMIQGTLIGLLGTGIGVGLGTLVALNVGVLVPWFEQLFGFRVLPPGIYVMAELPSDLHPGDVGVIAALACVLALVATVYPSRRAARVEPARALRYE
jgi:lipoprotein-releasing system permease protein